MNEQQSIPALLEADAAGDPIAAIALAKHYTQNGDQQEVVAAYRRAIDRGAQEALVDLGCYLWEILGDRSSAEALFREADDLGLVNGGGNLGRLLRETGDLVGARSAFRRTFERGSVRALGDYAILAATSGDLDPNETSQLTFDLCIAQDSFFLKRNMDAMSASMALDLVEERLDPEAVSAGYRRADESGSAIGAWGVGWIHSSNGNTMETISAFRRSIDRGHDRPFPYLASAYLEIGDRETAKKIALEGDERGVAESSTMYGMLVDEEGDLNGAIAAFRRGDAGGDGRGSLALGQCLCEKGEFAEAVEVLQRAIDRGVEGGEAALQLAKGALDNR